MSRFVPLYIALFFGLLFAPLSGVSAAEAAETKKAEETDAKVGLTLNTVLEYTYNNNPTLLAARSTLRATGELLPQAYAGWKPTVASTASVTETDIAGSNFGGGSGSTAKDIVLSVDQPLFRGGRTMAESSVARNTIKSQTAILISIEQDVLLDVATAYMDVLRDQAFLALSQNTRDLIAKQLEATKERFDVGELTKTDVSQARARLARAESEAITARGALNSSYAIFEQVVGMVPEKLVKPKMSLPAPENLADAILISERSNPTVLGALYAHKASEKDIDNVFGELLPEVGLFGAWNRTYDPAPGILNKQTTRAVGVSASIPLYQAGAVRSRVRQAKHTANSRYIEIQEVKRTVRQGVVSAWADWQAARSEIRSRAVQVDASLIAQEGVHAEAELGSRTILDSLDADQELLDAQVALVTAQRNEIVAEFTLFSTLGLLVPETLGFSGNSTNLSDNVRAARAEIFELHVDRLQEVE